MALSCVMKHLFFAIGMLLSACLSELFVFNIKNGMMNSVVSVHNIKACKLSLVEQCHLMVCSLILRIKPFCHSCSCSMNYLDVILLIHHQHLYKWKKHQSWFTSAEKMLYSWHIFITKFFSREKMESVARFYLLPLKNYVSFSLIDSMMHTSEKKQINNVFPSMHCNIYDLNLSPPSSTMPVPSKEKSM